MNFSLSQCCRFLLSVFVTSLFLIIFDASRSKAAIVGIEFSGVITEISALEFASEYDIAVGTTFSGALSWDTEILNTGANPQVGTYVHDGSLAAFSYHVGNLSVLDPIQVVFIANLSNSAGNYNDEFAADSEAFVETYRLLANFIVGDTEDVGDGVGVWDSIALPSPNTLLPLEQWEARQEFGFSVRSYSGGPLGRIDGQITSIQVTANPIIDSSQSTPPPPPSIVPIPSSLPLLLGGLVGLGWMARRRRS